MIQDIKDRIPTNVLSNGAIRYGVYDENNNLLRYEYIKREDEPSEEGTNINRALFKNLQGDLYSSNGYTDLVADKVETELDLSKSSPYSTLPSNITINKVAYGNGIWIAVGINGTILKSTDNKTWVSKTSGTSQNFYYALYDGTQFVAITMKYGYVYSSTDGETWTLNSSIGSSSVYIRGFDYKDGLYIALTDTPRIKTSTDLVTWTDRLTPTNMLLDVTHNDDCFIAVGSKGLVYKSTNGISWTNMTAIISEPYLNFVKWVKDRFIACSSGNIFYSLDEGASWTAIAVNMNTTTVNAYYDGTKYIVSTSMCFLCSYDGSTWESVISELSGEMLFSYFYANNIFAFKKYGSSNDIAFEIFNTTKAYKAYFKLPMPLSSYEPNKILRVKAVPNGGKSFFPGLNYLNINNLGEKPINSIFGSNDCLDLMYTGNGWNVIGPRFSYGELSISTTGIRNIDFGFNAKAVFVYCHKVGTPSNDGNSMGFIPLKYKTKTLLEVYANGPITIYGTLETHNNLTIEVNSLSANCVINYFAITW